MIVWSVRGVAMAAGLTAATLALAGCPAPQRTPEPVAPPVELEPEPEPPEPEPPPEAGVVTLSKALMLGSQGMSDAARDAAADAFVSSFEQGLHHFRRCYAAGLARDPGVAGTIDVDVVLEADGSIYEVKLVANDLGDAAMVRCVRRAFHRLDYQPLADGQYFSVTAPIRFEPE